MLTGDVQPRAQLPRDRRDPRHPLRARRPDPGPVVGTWGVINLEDDATRRFDDDDARLLEAFAAALGGALNAIDLYEHARPRLPREPPRRSRPRSSRRTPTRPSTRGRSPTTPSPSAGDSGSEGRSCGCSATPPPSTTSARSRSPARSSTSPARSIPGERAEVEQHTLIGERILEPIEFLAPIRPIVRHAHERWDGSGYPDGLAGEEIPLGARILFACDAYDAMTTDRPYRAAMPAEEARRELRSCAGSQFDPVVVGALIEVLECVEAELPSEV